ncbi:MAG: hypothetical protein AB1941_13490 [Gemmatimonadota bacterium]
MAATLRRIALALGTAALAACTSLLDPDPRADGVAFAVERAAYALGDTVAARLVNESGVAVGYNLCLASLERREGAGWLVVDELLIVCTADLRTLEPGESVPYRRALSAGLEAGVYRLRTHVEFPLTGGSRVEVRSAHFTVGR